MAYRTSERFPVYGRKGMTSLAQAYLPNTIDRAMPIRDTVQEMNCLLVFDVIRRHGLVTQPHIIEETNLSAGAVSQFVSSLIEAGLVRRVPETDLSDKESVTSGRKRVPLAIVGSSGYVVAIDIGQTHLRVVVANLEAKVQVRARQGQDVEADEIGEGRWNLCYTRHFDLAAGPEIVVPKIAGVVRDYLNYLSIPLNAHHIVGISVGIPGHVDSVHSYVDIASYGTNWNNVDMAARLTNALELIGNEAIPIHVENNANLGVLGVWHNPNLRASEPVSSDSDGNNIRTPLESLDRQVENIIYVKVGHTIEAGLFLNGSLYRGSHGTAGEIGHVPVKANTRRCSYCGRIGCLDTIAGFDAIIQASGIDVGQESLRDQRDQIDRVVDAARRGNAKSRMAIENAGIAIGQVLVNLINTLNPTEIVLDGAIVHTDGLFLNAVQQAVHDGLNKRGGSLPTSYTPHIRDLAKNSHAINYGGIYLAVESGWQRHVATRLFRR